MISNHHLRLVEETARGKKDEKVPGRATTKKIPSYLLCHSIDIHVHIFRKATIRVGQST